MLFRPCTSSFYSCRFIGGIILWTLRKIAGTAGALIILVVLGLASVLLLSRISLQLLFVKIKNSFSGISKRENKKDLRRTEYSQPVKQKNITVSKENTFNPYRDGEFSEFLTVTENFPNLRKGLKNLVLLKEFSEKPKSLQSASTL